MGGFSKQESTAITYIRVCAMLMIVMCHIFQVWFSSPAIGQALSVGVPVFFILSGFLYGQAAYPCTVTWVFKQFRKIIVPIYIFFVVGYCVLCFFSGPQELVLGDTIKLLLCLQGLFGGSLGELNVGHLWFVTYILICYAITPLLQYIRGCWSKGRIKLLLAGLFLAQAGFVLCVEPQHAWVNCYGLVAYTVAYFFSSAWNRELSNKDMVLISLLMILAVACRLTWKYFADLYGGFVAVLYDRLITGYCSQILAIWICAMIWKAATSLPRLFEKMYPAARFASKYSYEIYIVHVVFCAGSLNVRTENRGLILDFCVFLVLTLLSAVTLHEMVARLNDGLRKRHSPPFSNRA